MKNGPTCSTAFWITGWIIRCVSGISTFCCKCKRESSSSANFFLVIGMPTKEHAPNDVSQPVVPLPLRSCANNQSRRRNTIPQSDVRHEMSCCEACLNHSTKEAACDQSYTIRTWRTAHSRFLGYAQNAYCACITSDPYNCYDANR